MERITTKRHHEIFLWFHGIVRFGVRRHHSVAVREKFELAAFHIFGHRNVENAHLVRDKGVLARDSHCIIEM